MGSAAAYARARETIVRICRGEADARTLRLEALDAIRRAVGFDAYAWLLTDPETSVGSSPLADVPCLPRLPQLIRLKYATSVNRWTGLTSAASLHAVTGGSLSRSLMWRSCWASTRSRTSPRRCTGTASAAGGSWTCGALTRRNSP